MSDVPLNDADRLNMRKLLARIDRQREEALTFSARQRRLIAEALKRSAEEVKLRRERTMAPWQFAAALIGAGAALFGAGAAFLKLVGG